MAATWWFPSVFLFVVQHLEAHINHTSHDQQPHQAVQDLRFSVFWVDLKRCQMGPMVNYVPTRFQDQQLK